MSEKSIETIHHSNASLEGLAIRTISNTGQMHNMSSPPEYDPFKIHAKVVEAGMKLPSEDFEYIGSIVNVRTNIKRFFHISKK